MGWKFGDLALFNLVGSYDPKQDKLPVVILIYEVIVSGLKGWYCLYLNDLKRKRFIFNSELLKF